MYTKLDKIKDCQRAIGSRADGDPGEATWDAFAKYFDSVGEIEIDFPYSSRQFGCTVITGKPDQLNAMNTRGKHSVSEFRNSMSGSFTVVQSSNGERVPVSILVNDGNIVRNDACHSAPWDGGKPETVLYFLEDGSHGIGLYKRATELPKGVKTAIGGASLIRDGKGKFDAVAEGFVDKFADVYRTTQHNAIGVDKYGNVMMVLHTWCSAYSLQQRCLAMGMVDGIMVDGGSISAMNCEHKRYKQYLKQGYIIQLKG